MVQICRCVLLLLPVLVLLSCGGNAHSGVRLHLSSDNPKLYERGRYLVRSLAACGVCHGAQPIPQAPLSGGLEVEDSISTLKSANLTRASSGLKEWDVDDIVNAIRISKRPNGEDISPDIHRGYEWMSDSDLFSVAAYINSLPAIENDVERRGSGVFNTGLLGIIRGRREVAGHVPDVNPSNVLVYGEYLTDQVARCSYCHSSPAELFSSEGYLKAGRNIKMGDESREAPALDSSRLYGLGAYSEGEIVTYLKSGTTPEKHTVDPRFCPIGFYRNARDEDLVAIAKYLKSLTDK